MPDASISLSLSSDGGQNGFATLYMQVQNSDGTAPSMALNPANSLAVSVVQPVANTGADPSFPPASYPWVGVVQAQAVGTVALQLMSDNVVNQTIPVTVAPPAQTVSVTQSGIVVTAAT